MPLMLTPVLLETRILSLSAIALSVAQRRCRYDSATGILQANVNAGLGADFEIQLTAAPVLVVTDIIL